MTDATDAGNYRSADEQDVQVRVDGEEYGLSELVSVFERLPGFARDFLADETDYDIRIDDVQVEVDGEDVLLGSLGDAVPQVLYEEVEGQLEQYQEELEGYREEQDELLDELEERQDELEELREEYHELEERAEDREDRLEEAYKRIERKEAEVSALQTDIDQKQSEISEIEEMYLGMKSKFLEENSKVSDLAKRSQRRKQEIDRLEKELKKANNVIRQLKGEGGQGREGVEDDGEEVSAYRLDKSEVESASYDSLGGIDEQIERIRRPIVLRKEYPGAMQNIEDSPSGDKLSARLLVGAPGTGKTASAKAVANEVDMPVYLVNGPEIIDGIVGQAEGNVKGLFDEAREAAEENGGAMLIFDEIDSISRERGDINTTGVNDRVVNQMLSEMSGVLENENLYVLATTNRPDVIDPALKRPGRFGDIIVYPRPGREGTEDIASIYFPDEMVEDVTDIIAQYDDLDDPEVNSGDNIREVADKAKHAFLMEDHKRGGELVREIAEQEAQQVMEGNHSALEEVEGDILRQLKAKDWDTEELTDYFTRNIEQHLFETKDHLRYVPDDIIEDAVEEVYTQTSEDDRRWNELEDGDIRSILNPEAGGAEEEAAVVGA